MFIVAGFIMVGCSVLFASALVSKPDGLVGILVAVPFFAATIYLVPYAIRSRIIIEGSRITVRTAFGEKTADRSEILGFRTVSSRNGNYQQLYLKDGRSPISISQSFSTDEDFRAWFAQLTDLDERDKQKLLDDIAHDPELGATPDERLGALADAKTWNVFAIFVTVCAASALNWGPAPFRLPAAIVLALAPMVAVLLVERSPLLFAIFKQKSDPRSDFSFVFLASGFGLLLSATGSHFISVQPILMIAGFIALVLLAALYFTARNRFAVPGAIIGFLVVSGLYGYGLVSVLDILPDRSTPEFFATQVQSKHISRGKSTTYYLDLAPWGPIQVSNRLKVPSAIYNGTVEGQQVCLELHTGALLIPWYKRVDCSYQPDWIAPQ
jgi:hypothetical protein